MLEDLLLIKQIREGDIKAFETLFRKYYSPLVFYSKSITKSSQAAEDIIQDLFYKLWKEREKINIFKSVKNYLYISIRNRSLQYIQREGQVILSKTNYSLIAENEQTDASQNIEFIELEQVINKSMASMPKRRSKIFQMHRFQNMKYKEIAQTLSISEKTVEAEITKALKTLRKEIDIHIQTL